MPLPPTPSHSATSTAKTGRGNKSGAGAGAFLHLAFIGLIGAATVIMFSIASVSLLYTGEGPISGSRKAAAVSAEAFLPTLELPKLFPAPPPQASPVPSGEGHKSGGSQSVATERLDEPGAPHTRLREDGVIRLRWT